MTRSASRGGKHLAVTTLEGHPTRSFLGDTFRLTFARNEGAFLSLGADLPPAVRFALLTVTVGLLLGGLLIYASRSTQLTSLQVVGCALIASGGISNWIDRVRDSGVVVDFLNVGVGTLRTGIFNVADLAIVAGVVALLSSRRSPASHPSRSRS